MTGLLVWLLLAGPLWAGVGAALLPRQYRARALDSRLSGLSGGLWGAALGPVALTYLYRATPALRRGPHVRVPALLLGTELVLLFRSMYPTNACVTSPGYLLNQIQTGLIVGAVYATMAAGLTLIYSVQRIISFAHGQIVMFGGVISYLFLTRVWETNPLVAIPASGLAAFLLGIVAEKTLLSPIHAGKVERPGEYAILVTFGLGMLLQYALVGVLGSPTGIRAPRYTDRPLFGLSRSVLEFGPIRARTDYLIAGVIGLFLFAMLTWFLRRTWTGKSFRAVAMNPAAATVAGIDVGRSFTLAFGVGSMLAGMSGATLVPVMNFPVPDVASQTAIRSYVTIVLGGLGSVLGAFVGGLVLGAVEALTASCFPDPSRGATYQMAAGLLIFALVLLIKPQGLFGGGRS